MKAFALLFLATFYSNAFGYTINDNLDLKEILKLKCEAKAGEAAFADLWETAKGLKKCLQDVEDSKSPKTFPEYCQDNETLGEFYVCLKGVGAKLSLCLEEEEAYLPKFLGGVFNHTITEFCGDQGIPKLKYIMESLGDFNCFGSKFNIENTMKKCTADSFKLSENMVDGTLVMTKSKICSEFANLENCVSESIKEQCSGADHSKMVHDLMEPWLFACETKTETSS